MRITNLQQELAHRAVFDISDVLATKENQKQLDLNQFNINLCIEIAKQIEILFYESLPNGQINLITKE